MVRKQHVADLMTKGDMQWAAVPFENTINYFERERNLVDLSVRGLQTITKMPMAIEVLMKGKTNEDEIRTLQQRLETAKKYTEIVEAEQRTGFQSIYSHGAVSFWVGLEALVGDIIIAFLTNKPQTALMKPFCDIKLTVGEYRAMSESELSHALYREVERETKSIFQSGVNKFETILRTVGLDGKVSTKRAKDIYELHNIRNVILHKAGVVDHRFRTNFPWRRDKIADRIRVSAKDYRRYSESCGWYLIELIQRTRVLCGHGRHRAKRGAPEQHLP